MRAPTIGPPTRSRKTPWLSRWQETAQAAVAIVDRPRMSARAASAWSAVPPSLRCRGCRPET